MITESTVRSVSTVGNVVESSYTIEDSAKIFSILRSNIYSNKVLAVIREYSTNGWDGHIMAGTPERPIRVTLPTPLTPVFKVRDFGVGMSEETVMKVYTSYGTSTKDSSNDFNGTFGLGSKSAFAYGNTFGITSYFNGTKTFYTAYLDETNIGKIRKEFSEPTTEENGIEIELSVKSSDINAFQTTAQEFYRFFTPQPIFLGASENVINYIFDFHNMEQLYSGSNWSIKRFSNHGWRQSFSGTIVMGNVGYPLNLDALNLTDGSLRQLFSNNTTVTITVPIGSVSITASRESLEYDRKTQQFISEQLSNMQNELVNQIQDRINSFDNFWDCCAEYNNSSFISEFVAKKVTIAKYANLVSEIKTNGNYYSGQYSWDSVFIKKHIMDKFKVDMRDFNYFHGPSLRSYKTSNIVPRSKVVFVLNRPKKVKSNEISWRLRGVNKVYTDHSIVLVDFNNGDTSDELRAGILKGAKIVNLEDFDIVKYSNGRTRSVNRVVSNEMTKSKVFSFNGTINRVASESWDIEEVDLKNGKGVYVIIDKYQPLAFGNIHQLSGYIASFKKAIPAMQTDTLKIYGIRHSSMGSIGSGWVEFRQWANTELRKYIDKNNWMEQVTNLYNYEKLEYVIGPQPSYSVGRYWVNNLGYHKVLKMSELHGTDIQNFVKELMVYSREVKNDDMTQINSIVDFVKKWATDFALTGENTLKKHLQDIESKYPAIGEMLSQQYDSDVRFDQFKRYLNKISCGQLNVD